ncbi:hypothetical protein COCCADRAFT_2192 [Bipolaris zeicola 26-R-13]|uniref:Uncharacterized protein n=1 Tax=Cochliobolus carbonum (strain 26-R-13) TaxID=930089 RepID=W6YZ74_COCC2|nr:uncharacterized protein COCCADRAFT_2192 [Bipolaris zeicola 26-R-13]EUC36711.1 hypothetical protein COCCADRAFT_2192 [Bipolaris zeicola 26-R-13]
MAPKQQDEDPEKNAYKKLSMNGVLRPMAKRAGFKNFNRWNQDQLVDIFLEYDRVNQTRIRDLPEGYIASSADIDAQHALVDRLIKGNKLNPPVPKRKNEDDMETRKLKRAKVSSGDDDHVSSSDSGKSNDKRAPGGVAGTKGVSKTGSKAIRVQEKSKQVKKPATTKPAATKPRSRQASTRKPPQNKKNMDVGNPQDTESQDPSASAAHQPFVAPGANPGDDDDSSDSDGSDSGDDNGDDAVDGEDIEESVEDPEVEEISKAPPKSVAISMSIATSTSKGKSISKGKGQAEVKPKPLGLHHGIRKIGRFTSSDWDPLDESIPNSRLTWYEQEQRFRAQQEKARKEAGEKRLPHNEGEELEEEPKKEWDWKKQLRRRG